MKKRLFIMLMAAVFLFSGCEIPGLTRDEFDSGLWSGPEIEFQIDETPSGKIIEGFEFTLSDSADSETYTISQKYGPETTIDVVDDAFSYEDPKVTMSGTFFSAGYAKIDIEARGIVTGLGDVTILKTIYAAPALEKEAEWNIPFNIRTIFRKESMIYLGGTSFAIYDLNCIEPEFLSTLEMPMTTDKLTIGGNYAYSSFYDYEHPGFYIIDINDPATPEITAAFEFSRILDEDDNLKTPRIKHIVHYGNVVFAGTALGIFIIDCSNPATPVLQDNKILAYENIYSLNIHDGRLYAAVSNDDSEMVMYAYDISSLPAVTEATNITISEDVTETGCHIVSYTDHLIVSDLAGLKSYEITESALPALHHSIEMPFNSTQRFLNIEDSMMYIRDFSGSISLYKFFTGDDPELLTNIRHLSNPLYGSIAGEKLIIFSLCEITWLNTENLALQKYIYEQ
ncbi:MAG: hypothetical protein JEY99_02735 [Spirochaetales bacterium]|nr:hypothetical protein [Spirochaetales bacterium]